MKYSSILIQLVMAGWFTVACSGSGSIDDTEDTDGTGEATGAAGGQSSTTNSGGSNNLPSSGGSGAETGGQNQAGSGGQLSTGSGGTTIDNGSGGVDSGEGAAASGGAMGSGGAARSCDESTPLAEPPENVAAWIDESWDGQLGSNLKTREAWLVDSAMKGQGKINLCVRWGATSAPSANVKAQLAPSVESWFNDWFKALDDYDCFPYGDGITAKITGWAVRPGNESWVSDLGPEIAIYTETDGEGEPQCADACSFFTHWDHQFPGCPGGDKFHTDYWLWVDDTLPGGGGAAAVGGDWGLRMPVSTLVSRLGQSGDNIIEHEMGHGFGFQDYYDWMGSRPEGGSLMIVGSQGGGLPSIGDTWLLRRTWSEMREIRGW